MTTRILAVVAGNKEVGSGQGATISCVVSGLTVALDGVKWKNSAGDDVTTVTNSANYQVTAGDIDGDSQTTTLKVVETAATDTAYTCVITSDEWSLENDETAVLLGVFRK